MLEGHNSPVLYFFLFSVTTSIINIKHYMHLTKNFLQREFNLYVIEKI